jgi:nucleotide-binding universal stress UspA family protein
MDVAQPFIKRAVVAAAFSPRLSAVLNESHRILKLLGAAPVIVNVSDETPYNRVKLEEEIDRSNFKQHPPICFVRSGQPADVLIDAASEYKADLIVAGALKKEGLFKYYLGSVARNLARRSPCSVLLFTEPHAKPQPIKTIHCAVEYDKGSRSSIELAILIAYLAGTTNLFFTHSFRIGEWQEKKQSANDSDRIKKVYHSEDKKLKDYLAKFKFLGLSYQTRCLYERAKSVTLSFTREIAADLLIVPAPKNKLGILDRIFPRDLELALQDLPCSLLLTRQSAG